MPINVEFYDLQFEKIAVFVFAMIVDPGYHMVNFYSDQYANITSLKYQQKLSKMFIFGCTLAKVESIIK